MKSKKKLLIIVGVLIGVLPWVLVIVYSVKRFTELNSPEKWDKYINYCADENNYYGCFGTIRGVEYQNDNSYIIMNNIREQKENAYEYKSYEFKHYSIPNVFKNILVDRIELIIGLDVSFSAIETPYIDSLITYWVAELSFGNEEIINFENGKEAIVNYYSNKKL